MQWNEEMNSGFTTSTPWISVAENFKEINVEKALEDKESVFYHYKELIELRKTYDVITEGEYAILDENDPKIWAYTRTTESEVLLVINNFYGGNNVLCTSARSIRWNATRSITVEL